MGRHFLPRPDAEFASWTNSFATQIETDPSAYGLTPDDVDGYRRDERQFAEFYRLANTPETRTRPMVAGKDEARRVLEAATRRIVPIVRSTLGEHATGALTDLGLRPTATPRKRVPVPPEEPSVQARALPGGRVRLTIERSTYRRGRPRDAIGAAYFLHAGNTPLPIERWPIVELTTKTSVVLWPDREALLSMRSPRVWATACWLGPRLDRGPMARPVELAMVRPETVLPAKVRLAA